MSADDVLGHLALSTTWRRSVFCPTGEHKAEHIQIYEAGVHVFCSHWFLSFLLDCFQLFALSYFPSSPCCSPFCLRSISGFCSSLLLLRASLCVSLSLLTLSFLPRGSCRELHQLQRSLWLCVCVCVCVSLAWLCMWGFGFVCASMHVWVCCVE